MSAQCDLDDGDLATRVFISSLPCELDVESHKPVVLSLEPLFKLLQRVIQSLHLVGVPHIQMRDTIGFDGVEFCGEFTVISHGSKRIHG